MILEAEHVARTGSLALIVGVEQHQGGIALLGHHVAQSCPAYSCLGSKAVEILSPLDLGAEGTTGIWSGLPSVSLSIRSPG